MRHQILRLECTIVFGLNNRDSREMESTLMLTYSPEKNRQ